MGLEIDADLPPLPSVLVDAHFARIALLSDVHGNLPALEAALQDVKDADVDAIFFLGDHTWGPQPMQVLARARAEAVPTFFVRGNAERALIEYASGLREPETDVERWMVANHDVDAMAALGTFSLSISVEVGTLGMVKMCHGSPRSDIELLTPGMPSARRSKAISGIHERTVAHGHTHFQYQRRFEDRLIAAPGSVGIPYGVSEPGARWAILGNDVELRTTRYDISDAIAAANTANYPGAPRYESQLQNPPSLEELETIARERPFSE